MTGCSCWPPADTTILTTLPTPCARDGKGAGHQHGLTDLVEHHDLDLDHRPQAAPPPTPTARAYGSASAGAAARPSLAGLVTRRLLPTPRATDGTKGCPGQRGSHGDLTLPSAAVRLPPIPTGSDDRGSGGQGDSDDNLHATATATALPGTEAEATDADRWGLYADAVTQWEDLLGRPAPVPTQPGQHDRPVLAPAFVEWLMGLDTGWVTTLGLPRTLALRVLGNGVVPQQAALALVLLLCPNRWQVAP